MQSQFFQTLETNFFLFLPFFLFHSLSFKNFFNINLLQRQCFFFLEILKNRIIKYSWRHYCIELLTISPRSATFSPRTMNTPRGMSPYCLPTWILSIVLCRTKLANWSTLRRIPINVRPSRKTTIIFSVNKMTKQAKPSTLHTSKIASSQPNTYYLNLLIMLLFQVRQLHSFLIAF